MERIKLTQLQKSELEYRLYNILPDLDTESSAYYQIDGDYLVLPTLESIETVRKEITNNISNIRGAMQDGETGYIGTLSSMKSLLNKLPKEVN